MLKINGKYEMTDFVLCFKKNKSGNLRILRKRIQVRCSVSNPKISIQIRTFESHCGYLADYGMRHTRAFANICNAGVATNLFSEAAHEVCATNEISRRLNPLELGFSA